MTEGDIRYSPTTYFQATVETIVGALVKLPSGLLKQKMILLRVILVVLFSWQPLDNPCLLIGPSHINDIRGQGAAIGHQIDQTDAHVSSNIVYFMSQQCSKKFPDVIYLPYRKLLYQSKQAKTLPTLHLEHSSCSWK